MLYAVYWTGRKWHEVATDHGPRPYCCYAQRSSGDCWNLCGELTGLVTVG